MSDTSDVTDGSNTSDMTDRSDALHRVPSVRQQKNPTVCIRQRRGRNREEAKLVLPNPAEAWIGFPRIPLEPDGSANDSLMIPGPHALSSS
jgi:hypothetical protein